MGNVLPKSTKRWRQSAGMIVMTISLIIIVLVFQVTYSKTLIITTSFFNVKINDKVQTFNKAIFLNFLYFKLVLKITSV